MQLRNPTRLAPLKAARSTLSAGRLHPHTNTRPFNSLRKLASVATSSWLVGPDVVRWILCAFLFSIALPLPAQAQQQAVAKRVLMNPVVGPPDVLAKQVREMLVEALAKKPIAAVAAGEGADFSLRFYIIAAKEPNGAKVSYILDITDSRGNA